MCGLYTTSPNEITSECDIIARLDLAYLEDYADEVLGSVQYGSGHYVFHELDGRYFVMHTDSQGFKIVSELNRSEWKDAIREIANEYAELESDLI